MWTTQIYTFDKGEARRQKKTRQLEPTVGHTRKSQAYTKEMFGIPRTLINAKNTTERNRYEKWQKKAIS